jgi:integrase
MYVLLQTQKQELISMLTDPFRNSGEAYSEGALKDIPLSKITKGDIELWHTRMESIPTAANRALACLSICFEWDMNRKTNRLFLKDNNPCARIDKYPESKDKKFIDSIEKVLEMRNYCLNEITRDPHFLTFYLQDLECGERLVDIYGLAWKEPLRVADKEQCSGWISFRTQQLFLKDTKNREPAVIDLTEEAIQGLKKLQDLKSDPNTKASFAAGSIWVFPQASDPSKHINENSYRCKLRDFHFKFGLATRELVKVNKLKNGKNGKRKVYKYTNILTMKHIRKTFVTWYGREHGEEAASHRMRHSTLKVTRDHYFNADKERLKVKHMYSTGDNVVQLKKAGKNEQ